jgi:Fur family transcriptional regulator, peroxide stress response regulator
MIQTKIKIIIIIEAALMQQTVKKRNYSRKREAILKAVRSTTCHPTAEWVYQQLKPQYPDLSLGTVYRNLTQFKNDGVIISVGTVNGQERYDGNVKPHTHFVCSQCHAVIDVPGEFLNNRHIQETGEKMGLKIESSDVILHGVCSECLKREI